MTQSLLAAIVDMPGAPLAVVSTPDGVVRASGFGPLPELLARLGESDPATRGRAREVPATSLPAPVRDALAAYGAGLPEALDTVSVVQRGGPFHQAVWDVMRSIPAGTTVTYTRLAALAGRPMAVRAAGSACARNLAAPFVPCHRVVRTDGTFGGYAYGIEVKGRLIAHERGGR